MIWPLNSVESMCADVRTYAQMYMHRYMYIDMYMILCLMYKLQEYVSTACNALIAVKSCRVAREVHAKRCL